MAVRCPEVRDVAAHNLAKAIIFQRTDFIPHAHTLLDHESGESHLAVSSNRYGSSSACPISGLNTAVLRLANLH